MRIAGEAIGRRGAAVLSVTAVAAAFLAVHGYGHPGSLGVGGAGAISTGHLGPTASPSGGTAKPSPSPAATPTAAPSGSATPGPLLSSTQYGAYAFQIYPGAPSASARQALAGFTFTARPSAGSVDFTLYVSGGSQPPISKTYPASDRIYFIEANLGDDSGSAEYNFGDDGVVVTDSSGHVVQ